MSPIKSINTADKNLQLIQDAINTALKPLENIPMVGGYLLTDVLLTSAQDNLVEHGLDHTPIIYFTAVPSVSATIWSPAAVALGNVKANTKYLNLRTSATCSVTLWVA